MNDVSNIKSKILEIFNEKQLADEKYHNVLFTFLTNAYELVELSKGLYQIEHNIKLNQISLKDYILNSEICIWLKENNISNYKIEDLKMFMSKYEKQTNKDISVYKLSLELYEKLEEMKNIENTKIKNELTKTSTLLTDLDKIKSIEKANYQILYNDLLQQIKTKYLDTNLIDEKAKNYFMEILNDIFSYYLYGNKEIPIEN